MPGFLQALVYCIRLNGRIIQALVVDWMLRLPHIHALAGALGPFVKNSALVRIFTRIRNRRFIKIYPN